MRTQSLGKILKTKNTIHEHKKYSIVKEYFNPLVILCNPDLSIMTLFDSFVKAVKTLWMRLSKGLGDKRHRYKSVKNVAIILFQINDSQQNQAEKSEHLRQRQSIFNFDKATSFHFVISTATLSDQPGQHDCQLLWFMFTLKALESLETKMVDLLLKRNFFAFILYINKFNKIKHI